MLPHEIFFNTSVCIDLLYILTKPYLSSSYTHIKSREDSRFLFTCKANLTLLKNKQVVDFLCHGWGGHRIRKKLMKAVPEAITYISLSGNDKKVINTLEGKCELNRLYITCIQITENGLKAITNCKKLKSIFLDIDKKNKIKSLDALSECKVLERLKIRNAKKIEDSSLRKIAQNCKKLRLFSITASSISDETVQEFLKSDQLESLKLLECDRIGDEAFKDMENCKALSDIHLTYCKITDATLSKLAKREFKEVSLSKCPNITAQGVEVFQNAMKEWDANELAKANEPAKTN